MLQMQNDSFKSDCWMILSSLEDVFLSLPLLFGLQILPESLYSFTILSTTLFDLLTSLEIALMLKFFLDNLIMVFQVDLSIFFCKSYLKNKESNIWLFLIPGILLKSLFMLFWLPEEHE